MSSYYDFSGYAKDTGRQPICRWCLTKYFGSNLYWNERIGDWDSDITMAKRFDSPFEAKQWMRQRGLVASVWPAYE